MNQIVLSQIEQNILQLPIDEQLLLISRVAERLSKINDKKDFESELAKMAIDENIQCELKEIEKDFRYTEVDGLAK